MHRALKGVLWTLGAYAGLRLGARVVRRRWPAPMPAAMDWLYGIPPGLRRLEVGAIVRALDLAPGQHVLELGATLEELTGAVAYSLGATGRLVVIDSRVAALQRLGAAVPGLSNLSPMLADPHDVPCSEGTFDRALMASGLGGFRQPERVAKEAFRILKPHGVLVVAEEAFDLPERRVLDLALAAGFVLRSRQGGAWRYVLAFERPAAPAVLHAKREEHRIETYG